MKRIILLILLAGVLEGCETSIKTRAKDTFDAHIVYDDYGTVVYKIKIDSTEYLLARCVEGISIIKHK